MEYLEGGTLYSLLYMLKRFHKDLAWFYAAVIILAVNFLHNCGFVHKIKPMVDDVLEAKCINMRNACIRDLMV
jgi:hypothetical protein